MGAFRLGCLLLVLAGSLACPRPPRVTDTGYVGTWQRGSDRSRSTISIAKKQDQYLVRWTQTTADNRWSVRCDWDGRCEEVIDGRKTADYQFRTWVDEKSGHLMVESARQLIEPKDNQVHSVDELELEMGGKFLCCQTVERDGQRFPSGAGPRRWFSKVSDRIHDPP